jgi:hypothetical protein
MNPRLPECNPPRLLTAPNTPKLCSSSKTPEACTHARACPRRGWFDLPAQQITDEVKRDLRLLRLRGAMDPQRFYKSLDDTKFPKYFQLGTVVETPADFYAGTDRLGC